MTNRYNEGLTKNLRTTPPRLQKALELQNGLRGMTKYDEYHVRNDEEVGKMQRPRYDEQV